MKEELCKFDFKGRPVRVVTDEQGDPWWVAGDVCAALGYSANSSIHSLVGRVPTEWKGAKNFGIQGGKQDEIGLSEPGLYFFLARSGMPAALPFQKWIAGEVVPAIRKHGLYATPGAIEEMLADPDTMIQTLQALKAEREKRVALESQVERDKPVVVLGKAVTDTKRLFYLRECAAMLRQNGINIGQQRLFAWMRENGFLRRDRKDGAWTNEPTQRVMDLGLFRVVVRHNDERVFTTTKMTGKGMKYFVNRFLNGRSRQPIHA